jgi:molybdopterin synthase sulfur carrier subunit
VAVVLLPSVLAAEAGGTKSFEVEAPTAGAALRTLPIANLVFDEHGDLRPLVNVYVDGADVKHGDGLDTTLRDDSQVRVVAAIAGGVT